MPDIVDHLLAIGEPLSRDADIAAEAAAEIESLRVKLAGAERELTDKHRLLEFANALRAKAEARSDRLAAECTASRGCWQITNIDYVVPVEAVDRLVAARAAVDAANDLKETP